MRLEESLKGLLDALEKLRNRERDVPVIVEGRKDRKALKKMGVGGDIILIKRSKSIFHIIEEFQGKYEKVILLTDWDRTGGRLAHRIQKACDANGIICDADIRREIIKYVKKEVKDVESLPSFIDRARSVLGEPIPKKWENIEKY